MFVITNSVRDTGIERESIKYIDSGLVGDDLYIRYETQLRNGHGKYTRVQIIRNVKYPEDEEVFDEMRPVESRWIGEHEMKGEVSPDINSPFSSEIPNYDKMVSLKCFEGRYPWIRRIEQNWYHTPMQALCVVTVPVDIILMPLYGAFVLVAMSQMQ